VTAFNLMDNLDGATGTVSGVSAAGIGALALSFNAYAVAAAAFALAGACAGYLRFNLARPRARIFLGDGGSMPLGLLLAGLSIAALKPAHIHGSALFAGAMLVGLPIVDVALVSISRWRRGVTLTTGGRDHLTHRILPRAGSPRRVAAVLALLQAALAGLGILGAHLGVGGTSVIAAALAIGGLVAIGVLDGPRWRPAGVASATRPGDGELHSSVLAAQGAESQ
jgi:UDP-GlcNAc:undecaprenyl-phosphate GlcNAc-1-phosphate transferase